MRKSLIIPFLLFISKTAGSQDTIKVMTYNVLNYSETFFETRYNDLKNIIDYVQPDVVICQEVVTSAGAQMLLDNAFNAGGGSAWSRVTFVDGPDTDNMLFYRNSKIKFKSQAQIATALRNITHYRVYHLLSPTDTAWLNLFSGHLKASTGGGEEAQRLQECKNLCTYLGGLNANENLLVGGDMNFYNQSTETGFNWLTSNNCARRLYDPINMSGEWHNNAVYKKVHSQSTRTANEPDGGPTGGLDDRFDFLLGNDRVINGLSKVRYVPGSYTVIGQDQNHFNLAVNASPTNTSAPATVINSLYYMSDHLPVTIKLAMGDEVGYSEYSTNLPGTNVKWVYRENSSTADFLLNTETAMQVTARIYDLTGKEIQSKTILAPGGQTTLSIDMSSCTKGQYLLKIEAEEGWTGCKFVKY